MVSLSSVTRRFQVPFTVIEGGSGTIYGVVSEAEQNSQPAYLFSVPRLVLRTVANGLMKPGMVIESPEGHKYIAGFNGPSEHISGTLWDSFRMFTATDQVDWYRRGKVLDNVTQLEHDSGAEKVQDTPIWVAIEQISREQLDRKIHGSFETATFISAAPVLADDILGDRKVTRSDLQLGLKIGTLI